MPTRLAAPAAATAANPASFQRYYEEAGPDYAAWSSRYNMHFGFFRWGMNPFRREAMLEQMNQEILRRLHLNREAETRVPARILDMGCGLGATLRSFARRLPWTHLYRGGFLGGYWCLRLRLWRQYLLSPNSLVHVQRLWV